MEVLIRNRVIILALFFVILLISIIGSYKKLQIVYLTSAFICHILFFLLLLTESFGRVSETRNFALRATAILLLLLTGLTLLNIAYFSIISMIL